jgi:Aspartyl protease
MKTLPILSAALYVCLLCLSAAKAPAISVWRSAHNGPKPAEARPAFAVPIEIGPHGHIVVRVRVDNVEGRFILDTGAGINVITSKFAAKLNGIKEEDGYFTGFRATGEALKLRLYEARQIVIGDLNLHDPTVTVLDADLGNVDGLISLTCFRNQPFTIDFARKKLYLETASSLGVRARTGQTVPLQLDDDRGISLDMFTTVRVNDSLTLQISLDSGAGFNVFRFNSGFMKELGIDTSAATKYYKKSSLNEKITNTFYAAEVDKVSLLGAHSVDARDVKASFLAGLIYDGITGINWLGKRITIDIPDREMILN